MSATKVTKLNIDGLVPATYTPLDANGEVNLSLIPSYAAFVAKQGAKGVFINGTTGESVLLSIQERKTILDEWVKVAPKYNLKVLVMVSTNSIKDSQDLAKHAESLKVDGISAMSPSFFKPTTMDSLISFLKPIALSAPNTPFYYYHIPSMANAHGVQQPGWNMFDMIQEIEKYDLIPNFVGLKYTGMYATMLSFADVMNIIAYKNGKYEVFGGRDEMVAQLLCTGVKAFVGLSYNFAGKIYNDMIAAFKNRNIEKLREVQRISHKLTLIQQQVSNGKNGHKYMLVMAGLDVGDARPPSVRLTDEDRIRLNKLATGWNKKYKDTNTGYDIFKPCVISKL